MREEKKGKDRAVAVTTTVTLLNAAKPPSMLCPRKA